MRVQVRGTLCAETASALHGAVQDALSGRTHRLVLDLDRVFGGRGVSWWVLHAVADQARRQGVVPIAAVPNPRLRARLADVAACGLRLVAALPAMGEFSGPAEPSRMTVPTATRLSGWGIEDLLRRYGTALAQGDAVAASRCHTAPTFVTESRSVVTIPTLEELAGDLTRLARSYRDAGLDSARPALETVRLLDARHCETTVLWCHGGSGRSCVHARYRYLLRRVPDGLATGGAAGHTRINTVTLLEGPRVVAPLVD